MSPVREQAVGVACALGAALCFTAIDTMARRLGSAVPLLVLLVFRYGLQAVLMAVYLAASRRHGFATASPWFQLLRGALLLMVSAFSFFGVRYVPVAEATAITMLTPVIVTLVAATAFGERVSPLRWALVLGAFAGVLVIVRPGSGLFGWAVVFPLGVAVSNASFQLLTGRMALSREDPLTTHFWTAATGLAVLAPLMILSPVDFMPTLVALPTWALLLVVLVGVGGTVGHLLLILAFQRAPASLLSPLMYLQIAFAVLLGWFVTHDWPDGWAWVGMAIVAACGAATAALNLRRAAIDQRAPAPTVRCD